LGEYGGMKPLHIGIAACSAEGAALCYRTICTEAPQLMGGHDHPEVTLHTPPFDDYMKPIYRGDWQAVGALMLASAEKLARIGAQFVICPNNTIHQALPFIEAKSPIPWLHIASSVADEAVARGFKRIAITGTRWLTDSEVYPQKLTARGLEWVRPSVPERDEINRFIMDEMVRGVFSAPAVAYCQKVIGRLKKDEGCDAVVMGCTEIPLLMNDGNSPLPTLDSTRLLARAALHRAIEGAAKAA
jgi:aspartate racemase